MDGQASDHTLQVDHDLGREASGVRKVLPKLGVLAQLSGGWQPEAAEAGLEGISTACVCVCIYVRVIVICLCLLFFTSASFHAASVCVTRESTVLQS